LPEEVVDVLPMNELERVTEQGSKRLGSIEFLQLHWWTSRNRRQKRFTTSEIWIQEKHTDNTVWVLIIFSKFMELTNSRKLTSWKIW
jgi:hypothetical protein